MTAMTRHLSDQALLEIVERGEHHPHLDRCARCREHIAGAREAIELARQVEVPEPSPLFWDHLSARIHDAIEAEPPTARPRWTAGVIWHRLACVGVAILLVLGGIWRIESARRSPRPASAVNESASPASRPADAISESSEAAADASWSLVTEAAAGVDLDTVTTEEAGFALRPGAAESAASQLSAAEQRELVRLLQAAVETPHAK